MTGRAAAPSTADTLELYVIDFSGAGRHDEAQAGLAVVGGEVDKPPRLFCPLGRGRRWSRVGLLAWLGSLAGRARTRPVVVGLDFSFAFPWEPSARGGAYHDGSRGAASLWRAVASTAWPHVEPICRRPAPRARDYVHRHRDRFQGGAGCVEALRLTERAARDQGLRPMSVFHTVGPQVAASSITGMAMLHHLRPRLRACLVSMRVWPMLHQTPEGRLQPDAPTRPPRPGELTLLEVYPSLWRRAAPTGPTVRRRLEAAERLDAATPAPRPRWRPATEHEDDAAIAWASLASLDPAGVPLVTDLLTRPTAALSRALRQARPTLMKEGWILGV